MKLIQIVTVKNTSDESLEITRWVNSNQNIQKIEKETLAILTRLYSKLSMRKKNLHEKTMLGVGSNMESNVSSMQAKRLTNKIHYVLYEGRCLDSKKLSYFVPNKTIKRGELTLQQFLKMLYS